MECRPCQQGRCDECARWDWPGMDVCAHDCGWDDFQMELWDRGSRAEQQLRRRRPTAG